MEKPKQCYIRQEWFEAISYMPKDLRCDFYEGLLSFVYYGSRGDTLPPEVRGIFNLAKISLEKDIEKYNNKVITNRQNGSIGGRPRRGLTQNNPTEPNGTQQNHNIHIQNVYNKLSTFLPFPEPVERERIVFVELFRRGSLDAISEARKLCNYYDARGWVDKGGNQIVDVAALAKVWKMQDESSYFANVRKKWTDFYTTLPTETPVTMLTEFTRLERKNQAGVITMVIYCTGEDPMKICEGKYITQLTSFVNSQQCKRLEWVILDKRQASILAVAPPDPGAEVL